MASPERHYTLTLSGSAERVPRPTGTDGRVRMFSLQPDPANANPIYIGDDSTDNLTSSDWGVCLPTPVGGVMCPPYVKDGFEDGAVDPNDTWVLGTNGEKLHISYTMVGRAATLLRRGGGGA